MNAQDRTPVAIPRAPMDWHPWLAVVIGLHGLAMATPAQSWQAIPPQFSATQGNVGLAMPARWTQGSMQVLYDGPAVPTSFANGSLAGVRVRRAVFLGDGAWPSATVSMRLSLASGPQLPLPANMTSNAGVNRTQSNPTLVFGPGNVSIASTPTPSAGEAVGVDMIQFPFAQPFVFAGPRFFVDWENLDSALNVFQEQWVDAVHLPHGDDGLAATVGNGGCGSFPVTAPMQLSWAGATGPGFGRDLRLSLSYGRPDAAAAILLSYDPAPRGGLGLPFGADLSPLGAPGCHLWSTVDGPLPLATLSPFGQLAISLPTPNQTWLHGETLGVQVFCIDQGLNALNWSLSNGVILRMNRVGCGTGFSTLLVAGGGSQSQWEPWRGMAPILTFEVR